jgi:hypothetical protein
MARQGQGPGSRAYPINKPYKGRPTNSHKSGGGQPPKKRDCCPMVAAVRSVKRGKFRLARRYAALSARLIAERGLHAVARS